MILAHQRRVHILAQDVLGTDGDVKIDRQLEILSFLAKIEGSHGPDARVEAEVEFELQIRDRKLTKMLIG